jgi:hypothetical protein
VQYPGWAGLVAMDTTTAKVILISKHRISSIQTSVSCKLNAERGALPNNIAVSDPFGIDSDAEATLKAVIAERM